MRPLALALLLTASSGCSFLFVEGLPPPRERGPRSNCTSSQFAPVVDSLLVASDAAVTTYVFVNGDSSYPGTGLSHGTSLVVGVTSVFLHAASAAYGFNRTHECREALGLPEPKSGAPSPAWQLGPQRSPRAPSEDEDE